MSLRRAGHPIWPSLIKNGILNMVHVGPNNRDRLAMFSSYLNELSNYINNYLLCTLKTYI